MLIITYRFCAEGAYYDAAGEIFAGFCGHKEKCTGLQAPQAKILRVFCGREGKFCGFHGLHYLLRMQLLTPGSEGGRRCEGSVRSFLLLRRSFPPADRRLRRRVLLPVSYTVSVRKALPVAALSDKLFPSQHCCVRTRRGRFPPRSSRAAPSPATASSVARRCTSARPRARAPALRTRACLLRSRTRDPCPARPAGIVPAHSVP